MLSAAARQVVIVGVHVQVLNVLDDVAELCARVGATARLVRHLARVQIVDIVVHERRLGLVLDRERAQGLGRLAATLPFLAAHTAQVSLDDLARRVVDILRKRIQQCGHLARVHIEQSNEDSRGGLAQLLTLRLGRQCHDATHGILEIIGGSDVRRVHAKQQRLHVLKHGNFHLVVGHLN